MPIPVVVALPSRRVAVINPPRGASGAPLLPEGDPTAYALLEVADAEAAKFATVANGFTVDAQGIVTVVPLSAQEQAARDAEAAAAQERATALDDLRTTYQAAFDQLTAYIDDPTTTDTQAEVRTGFIFVCRVVRRLLRYEKAQAT